MNNTLKGKELLQDLKANRFSFHKIEKDLEIANGTLKKVVDGKIQLSDTNYRKIQGYFIANVLKMEPDQNFQSVLSELDTLKDCVAQLEAENSILKAKLQEVPSTKIDSKKTTPEPEDTQFNESILDQIKNIRAEKIPKERDTLLGRKAWQMEQNERINELKNKLK